MDLGEIGLRGVDWIRLAQDRDQWRTVVSAVMNLRFLAPQSYYYYLLDSPKWALAFFKSFPNLPYLMQNSSPKILKSWSTLSPI
jgi:hypothetical protein